VKTGLYSTVFRERNVEWYESARNNQEILGTIDEEIAAMRACVLRFDQGVESLNIPNDGARAQILSEMLERVTRAVKRKTDIERRDALVLSPGEVGEFLTKLGMAIGKHVGDPAVVARIGAELKSLLTPGRDGRVLATR
ncbi:MAG: hypothetical protein IH962_00900, partial [Chloroflexi bacterium]|nr:hypothetical protein [Chloroflexota bacterium]